MRIGAYAVALGALLSGFSAAVAQDVSYPTKIFVCAPVNPSLARYYVRCPIGQSDEILSGQCQCPKDFVLLSDDGPAAINPPPILVSQ